MRTVSTGKMSESPEPLWEPWRTEGGAEQNTEKFNSNLLTGDVSWVAS